MTVVYFILYKLIPGCEEGKNTTKLLMMCMACVFFGALVLRLLIHLIIWPYIYHESHASLKFLALLARYFYSLLDLMQVVGIAVCIKLYKLRMESIKNEKNLVIEKSRAELLHLKAQTNPHFLFNTLNSIYSLSRSKSEQTSDTIMRLSKLMRYTLYDSDKKTICISDELKIIKDYIELQQLRFGNRIQIKLETDIDSESTAITPLLLLPLIENAYKHCDESLATIFINIVTDKNTLRLVTSNPKSERIVSSSGTGLLNLKRQLELLYKDYSLNYSIKENNFVLELIINLSSYAGNELFDS